MQKITLLSILFLSMGTFSKECPISQNDWIKSLTKFSSELTPNLGNPELYRKGPKLLPSHKYQELLDFWKKCKNKSSLYIKNKFKNILGHSNFMVKAMKEGHSGFSISDKEYLLTSLEANPDFAKIPSVFFKDNYLPENWRNTLKECQTATKSEICLKIKEWKIIEFNSTLEDGSGHHKRVVIQINYEHFIQYLLFFPEHPRNNDNRLVDIIALQTRDLKSNLKLKRPRPYFFERHKKGFSIDGGRCISCHPNGLREIVPMQGSSLSSFFRKSIDQFNSKVRDLGKPDWSGNFNAEVLGPPVGDSCISCHSSSGVRSPLSIFTHPTLIRSKIHELEMPYPKLYSLYYDALKRLNLKEHLNTKKYIDSFIRKSRALPSKDYRNKGQIRDSRKKIQRALLRNRIISHLEYQVIRFVEFLTRVHMDFKLKNLFRKHETKFRNWLKGKETYKSKITIHPS